MTELIIKASTRSERGRQNKKLRKNKMVPAVVYGGGQKNMALSIDLREAEKYSKKEYENKIFTFESENKSLQGLKVIKKSISYHKLNRRPIHMDFFSLDMKKPIRVHVDVHFKGTPKGVKEENGVFNIILRSVELECLPDEIPPALDLDVSSLALNQNIHVSDLKLPDKLKLITKGQRTLCTVVTAKKEESAKSAEEAGAVAVDEKAPASAEGKTPSGAKPASTEKTANKK